MAIQSEVQRAINQNRREDFITEGTEMTVALGTEQKRREDRAMIDLAEMGRSGAAPLRWGMRHTENGF